MRRNFLFVLLVFALVPFHLSGQVQIKAAAPPATLPNQIVAGFTGGAVWTSADSAVAVWYFPVLGNFETGDLFALNSVAVPAVDREHAYFVWVYDMKVQNRTQNGSGNAKMTVAVIPAGTATIYYSPNPLARDWSDLTQRATWGTPVATFNCSPAMFYSPDSFQVSDKLYISANLVRSQPVAMRGKTFNFSDLIPHGMTCFSYGQQFSALQTGSCVAMGN